MSSDRQNLARRERAIEALQRQLRWVEILMRRLKAGIARLSADCEDDVAEALSREWGRPEDCDVEAEPESVAVGAAQCSAGLNGEARSCRGSSASDTSAFAFERDTAPIWLNEPSVADSEPLGVEEFSPEWADAPPALSEPLDFAASDVGKSSRADSVWNHAKVAPIACSCTLHTAIIVFLAFGVSYTVAKLQDHSMTLLTSLPETTSDASLPAPLGDDELEPTAFSGDESATALVPDESVALSGGVIPAMDLVESSTSPIPTGDIGRLDHLPSDLGTLLAGPETSAGGLPGNGDGAAAGRGNSGGNGNGNGGKRGGGSTNGSRNATLFFGTHAKGNRFVFVIDNSSSMKDGRLDMARVELLRTVQNLSPKQSFYVIFVSDQTYPMFFPQREPAMMPATPLNVKRLAEWLPNAILASGKNRELIKAMDMAAALQPDAVYLLWDGDMKYSESVRLDVMAHLTAPNQSNFTVHTLGLGATSAEAEQNLAAIAQAHGGVYRRVDVPGVKARK